MMPYDDASDNNSTNDLEERWKVQAALIDTQTSDGIVTVAGSPFTEWAKVGFPPDMFELTSDDIVAITNVYTSPFHQPITQMSIVSLNNSDVCSMEEPSIKNEEELLGKSELEEGVLPGVPSVEQATARDGFRETAEIVEYGISWISDNIRPNIRFCKRLYNKHYINSKRRRKSKPYNRNHSQLSSSDEYGDAMQRVNPIEMLKCKPHECCCAYKAHTNNIQNNTKPSDSSVKISNCANNIPSSREKIVSQDKTSSSSKDVSSVNLAASTSPEHKEYVDTLDPSRIPKPRKQHHHKRYCVHGSHHKYKHTSRLHNEDISTGLAPLLSELITEIKTTRLYLQKQKLNKQESEDLFSSTDSCGSRSDLAPPPTSTMLNGQYSDSRDYSNSSNGFANPSLISVGDNWSNFELSKSLSASSRSASPLARSHMNDTDSSDYDHNENVLLQSNIKSLRSSYEISFNNQIGRENIADDDDQMLSWDSKSSSASSRSARSHKKETESCESSSDLEPPPTSTTLNSQYSDNSDSSDYDNNKHFLMQSNIKSLRSAYEKSINNHIGRENIANDDDQTLSWKSEEFLDDYYQSPTRPFSVDEQSDGSTTAAHFEVSKSSSASSPDSSDYDHLEHVLLKSSIKSMRSTYEESINNHIGRGNIANDYDQTLSCDSGEFLDDYYQSPTRPFSADEQSDGSTTAAHFEISKSSSASSPDSSDYDHLEHVLLKSSIKSMRSTYEESINNHIGRGNIADDYDQTLSCDSGEFREKNCYKPPSSQVRSDDQCDQRTHLRDSRKSQIKRSKESVDDISHNSTSKMSPLTVSSTETVSTNGNEEVKKSPVVGSFWNTVDPLGLSSSLQQPPISTIGGFRMPDTPRPKLYGPQPGFYSYWEGISANNEDNSQKPESIDTIQYPYTSVYCTDESSTAEESMSSVDTELTEEETRREIRNIVQTIASIRQQENVLSQSMISLREERWYFEGKLCDLLEKPVGNTNSCTYLQNNELRSHYTRVTSPSMNRCNNTPATVECKLPIAKNIVSSEGGVYQNVGQKTDSSEVINLQQYSSPDPQAFNFLIPTNMS